MVGTNDGPFGELEFSSKPIWRIKWWHKGNIHRDTGYIDKNFQKFIDHIFNDSIPGIKSMKLDEKIKLINSDFD